MKLVVCVMTLIIGSGCGSKASRPVHNAQAAGGFQVAPQYAALFRKGETWIYDVSQTHRSDDESKEESVTQQTTSQCTVVDVRAFEDGVASRITCTPSFVGKWTSSFGEPIAGTWAADRRGVWALGKDDLAGPLDHHAQVLLPADPHAGPDATGSTIKYEPTLAAWCIASEGGGEEGPEASRELCLGERGIVRGTADFMPGSNADREVMTYGLQPATRAHAQAASIGAR
jgi:hypothetical protein